MANRIAFLSRLPPSAMLSKLFGTEYLSQSGFDLFFLDLSGLVDGLDEQHLYQEQEPLNSYKTIVIRRIDELEAFVKEGLGSTIFIDYVAGLAEFNLNTGQVFKILKKYNAKYYIVSNGSIPSDHQDANDLALGFLLKVKKALKKPRLLVDFFTRKLIVQLIKLNIFYQKPYRVFGIKNSPIVMSYLKKYGMSPSAIMPINSRDYDTYLEYMRETAQVVTSAEICVFLDEDHTNHPDYSVFGITPLNEAEYTSSMNHFFDCVEKKTGLSVVIAAHPKSRFSAENHPYGNRTFTQGNTVQLVAKSKMVIAHSSTSISYPVLFCKPIVLAVTSEMKSRIDMIKAVKAFASELGLIPIDVDCADEVSVFEIELERHIDYKSYLHRYVKNMEPVNKILCEIVADVARKDLARLELTKKVSQEGCNIDQ